PCWKVGRFHLGSRGRIRFTCVTAHAIRLPRLRRDSRLARRSVGYRVNGIITRDTSFQMTRLARLRLAHQQEPTKCNKRSQNGPAIRTFGGDEISCCRFGLHAILTFFESSTKQDRPRQPRVFERKSKTSSWRHASCARGSDGRSSAQSTVS